MPKSVFLNEPQADLKLLIDQGFRLWGEEAELRPSKNLEKLWTLAFESMDSKSHQIRSNAYQNYLSSHKEQIAQKMIEFGVNADSATRPPQRMSAQDARLLILNGNLFPKEWKGPGPYPYQGLFVSAFYFLEAKNFLEESKPNLAWASLTQAYYYLGMNSSSLTAQESAVGAAKSRHFKNSVEIREIIVSILVSLQQDPSINSSAQARERVIAEIAANPDYMQVLEAFDGKASRRKRASGASDKADLPNPSSPSAPPRDATDRLRDRLAVWESPNGPYPDIAAALAPFKREQH